ncbi:T9SS type A sorting domain-containing protein [Niastella caeni]|uniref:T9SS type A sorting domain-containing protein n=1 Tax=Niastella caeni TaxID=2569763 RepID=A0A4S8HYZ0_9BACT|nr:T9SS type A sorting domain-containing protein [Niastella caeni]THU40581.1 T9SS type A sorting domain-containing protein [Niastella caeni]
MKQLIYICLLSCIVQSALANSGIYAGGPVYKNRSYSISELKGSGYTCVVVWTIHIDAGGNFNFNAEFPLVQNGTYVGAGSYPNFASDIASLKSAPTTINRLEFCLSAWGSSTFANIRNLINAQGTGATSILYRNFQALKCTFPAVDAIGFDDESTYDVSSATALAVMLGGLGFKVSLVPYTAASFWTSVAANTNNQRPGTVDRVDLQCYAGGAGNNPCNWNFGNIPVYAGLWDQEKTTSQVQSQLTTWRNNCGVDGGFMWLYDDFDNTTGTEAYAAAINNVFGGGGVNNPAATFYKDCNYTGYAVTLAVGSYTLSQLISYGILNDDISSLTVQPGYSVTLYWDDNFAGATLSKTASDGCLVDDGWNDKVSSIRINSASVTSAARVQNMPATDNAISSMPGQQEIKFFEGSNLAGIPVRIYDIKGQQVMTVRPISNRINISSLTPGVYVMVYMQQGKLATRRFVK